MFEKSEAINYGGSGVYKKLLNYLCLVGTKHQLPETITTINILYIFTTNILEKIIKFILTDQF